MIENTNARHGVNEHVASDTTTGRRQAAAHRSILPTNSGRLLACIYRHNIRGAFMIGTFVTGIHTMYSGIE